MGHCFFVWDAACVGYDASATAAWAQAILSAGAVVMAWWLQNRSAKVRDNELLRMRLSGVASVVQIAADLIREADQSSKSSDPIVWMGFLMKDGLDESFQRTLELLDRIPLHEQPSGDLAISLHNLREMVGSMARKLERGRAVALARTIIPNLYFEMEVQVVRDVEREFAAAWKATGGR